MTDSNLESTLSNSNKIKKTTGFSKLKKINNQIPFFGQSIQNMKKRENIRWV